MSNQPDNSAGQSDIGKTDERFKKGHQANEQSKKDAPRVKTVTPDNENGKPGAPDSSNKGKGPAGENL